MQQTTYAILFRGLNVGGKRVVPMPTLRTVLTEAGFGHVQTYIQSGNAVLTSALGADAVQQRVAQAFEAAFGFASHPTVRDQASWRAILQGNPFVAQGADTKALHAVLLDAEPTNEALDALRALATPTESLALGRVVLYIHAPDGIGRSALVAQLDRKLRVPLTTRNWATMLAVGELVG